MKSWTMFSQISIVLYWKIYSNHGLAQLLNSWWNITYDGNRPSSQGYQTKGFVII